MTASELNQKFRLDQKPLPPPSYLQSIVDRYLGDRPSFVKKDFIPLFVNYAELMRSQRLRILLEEDFNKLKNKIEMDLLDVCKALINEHERDFDQAFIEQDVIESFRLNMRELVRGGDMREALALASDFMNSRQSYYSTEVERKRQAFQKGSALSHKKSDLISSQLAEYLVILSDKLRLESYFLQKNRWHSMEEAVQLFLKNKPVAAIDLILEKTPTEGRVYREAVWLNHSYERLRRDLRLGTVQIETYFEMRATIFEEAIEFAMRLEHNK